MLLENNDIAYIKQEETEDQKHDYLNWNKYINWKKKHIIINNKRVDFPNKKFRFT